MTNEMAANIWLGIAPGILDGDLSSAAMGGWRRTAQSWWNRSCKFGYGKLDVPKTEINATTRGEEMVLS